MPVKYLGTGEGTVFKFQRQGLLKGSIHSGSPSAAEGKEYPSCPLDLVSWRLEDPMLFTRSQDYILIFDSSYGLI